VIQDSTGQITHLSTAVQYGGTHGDASYALVQPVRTEQSSEGKELREMRGRREKEMRET
jgi:hypothetical protein